MLGPLGVKYGPNTRVLAAVQASGSGELAKPALPHPFLAHPSMRDIPEQEKDVTRVPCTLAILIVTQPPQLPLGLGAHSHGFKMPLPPPTPSGPD